LARESHHLQEQMIHKIRAPIGVQLYGAQQVTASKRRKFLLRPNRVWQAATTWSDADQQRAIERLQREIHQVTPAKHKLFDKLFQHQERQLLQEVRTKATGPRSIFAKTLAHMNTGAEEEACWAGNITADQRVQFLVHLSNAEFEATIWSMADTDHVVNQLERAIYGITSKDQMLFMKEFSICLVEFEAW
jgi:hypothetical protein